MLAQSLAQIVLLTHKHTHAHKHQFRYGNKMGNISNYEFICYAIYDKTPCLSFKRYQVMWLPCTEKLCDILTAIAKGKHSLSISALQIKSFSSIWMVQSFHSVIGTSFLRINSNANLFICFFFFELNPFCYVPFLFSILFVWQ